MANTKIKSDEKGLYIASEGYIWRPAKISRFKKGNEVRFSHPAGGVGFLRVGKNGTPSFYEEMWDAIETIDEYRNPNLYNRYEDDFLNSRGVYRNVVWDTRCSVLKRKKI